jgi:hypothetical protein
VLDHRFLTPYDGVYGQAVLAVVVATYAVGILWLRRLARFETPQRLLTTVWQGAPAEAGPAGTGHAGTGQHGTGQFGTGQFGTGQFAGRGSRS